MFAIVQNNTIIKTIQAHTEFELNGKHYNAKWTVRMTPEEKQALGICEIKYGPRPDEQFYWVHSNGLQLLDGVPTETYYGTSKDLDQLKNQMIAECKATAFSKLANTDWMVIRKAERNVAIPENVQAERDWIVTECTRIEDAINAASDVEELIEIKTAAWIQEQEQEITIESAGSAGPV